MLFVEWGHDKWRCDGTLLSTSSGGGGLVLGGGVGWGGHGGRWSSIYLGDGVGVGLGGWMSQSHEKRTDHFGNRITIQEKGNRITIQEKAEL